MPPLSPTRAFAADTNEREWLKVESRLRIELDDARFTAMTNNDDDDGFSARFTDMD
jgi:hypothetical protein